MFGKFVSLNANSLVASHAFTITFPVRSVIGQHGSLQSKLPTTLHSTVTSAGKLDIKGSFKTLAKIDKRRTRARRPRNTRSFRKGDMEFNIEIIQFHSCGLLDASVTRPTQRKRFFGCWYVVSTKVRPYWPSSFTKTSKSCGSCETCFTII